MRHQFRFLGDHRGGDLWTLGDEESLHLTKVLRLTPGTEVEVTDGVGHVGRGVVAVAHIRESVIAAPVQFEAAPAPRLGFAIGALKPGAIDEILPALTELGIDDVHIFQQLGAAKARLTPKVLERWQRIVVQASKQCKRAWLPRLHEHESVAAMAAAVAGQRRVMLRGAAGDLSLSALLGSRGGSVAGDPSLSLGTQPQAARAAGDLAPNALRRPHGGGEPLVVVAGGEKGFDPSEEELLLAAGWAPASLGPYVLRAVTAAVAAAATMSLHRADLC